MPPAERRLGRRAEVVDELADVAGIVGELVDDRRHPQHDAEHRRRGDQAPLPPVVASPPGDVTERGEHQRARRHEVGHVGLRAQRPGDDGRHEHQRVAAQHGPHGEQDDDPRQQRQVRVPGLGEQELPVAADRQHQHRAHGRHAEPTAPAPADPQGGGDRARGARRSPPPPAPTGSSRAGGTSAPAGRSSAGRGGSPGSGTRRCARAARSAGCAGRTTSRTRNSVIARSSTGYQCRPCRAIAATTSGSPTTAVPTSTYGQPRP